MRSTRRDFLQRSAAAATAAAIGPVTSTAAAESLVRLEPASSAREKPTDTSRLHARPVPSGRVRVTGGPLKQAQDATAKYLLELEPDRMLAYYRVRAGLPQKAEPYAGWDGGGRNLTGHIAGHYLSAVSLMYLATGDARYKQRADYVVRELATVQDKHGDGYLSALEGGREAFAAVSKGEIRSGAFDLNGLWSPWYTLHKTFAGLRDAYRHTGNRTALEVETKYAGWAERVLAPLDDGQVAKMLNTEHGGMNEVLADLSVDTGDRRWLDLSYRFEHHEFTDALKRHQDNLNGKHGNCQIPKLIGSAARYAYTGDAGDLVAASFFWDRVTQHHSYATGGHGLAEYFGPPDRLGARVDGRTCESCNTYNMLKLTRRLFSFRPDAFYADFQERAIFNHALASIDPESGRTSYMVPVGRGVQQEYQDMLRSFTCCVGTGMENHGLYGDGLYWESADTLWVNLFVPSTAQFTLGGVRLAMDTTFPDGDSATIRLTLPSPKAFTLAIRRPSWAADDFGVRVNGAPIDLPRLATLRAGPAGGRDVPIERTDLQPSTYVELRRTWKSGDMVEIAFRKVLRLEPTRDDSSIAAIMWGPLALAADHGPRVEGRARTADGAATVPPAPPPVPVLVAAGRPLAEWVVPSGSRDGDFLARGVARIPGAPGPATDVVLTPFYRTHGRRYSIYADVITPAQLEARDAEIAAERERVRRLEAATLGFAQPGETQTERELNYQSDPADRALQRAGGRTSRAGTGWFSFDLPVDGSGDIAVVVTYFNDLGLPPAAGDFEILVAGTSIARFQPNATATGFYDTRYVVPAEVARGKSKITVRFQASPTGRIAPVFGVRTIRAKDA
jgi:DUF1680 family protein